MLTSSTKGRALVRAGQPAFQPTGADRVRPHGALRSQLGVAPANMGQAASVAAAGRTLWPPQLKLAQAASMLLAAMLGLGCTGQNGNPSPGSGGSTPRPNGGTMGTGGGSGGTSGGATAGSKVDAATTTGGQGGTQTTVADAAAGSVSSDAASIPRDGASESSGGTGGTTGAGGSSKTGGTAGAGGTTRAGGTTAAGGTTSTGGRTGVGGATGVGGQAGTGGTPGTAGQTGAGGALTVTFRNGVFWNDTSGKRIEAHGGGFLKVGDTWYWFGEDKSKNSGTFNAVNCYASKDLVTWQFRNALITRSTATQLNTSDRIIERPKVIYNDSSKQYVMWAHWDNGDYSEASAGIFTCPTVDGNYTFVKSFKPLGNMSRDCNLFKEDNGTAYFMSAANNNADMMMYQLTDDYLDVKQLTVKLWAGSSREAPAMFKAGGTYFMINSAATGWNSNQAQYASASAVAGPWTSLANIGDSTTFDTQSTYVIPIVGSETTTFIYAGDRWQDPDLVSSKYIWLPLVVNGTKLSMSNSTQWSLNLTTGRTN